MSIKTLHNIALEGEDGKFSSGSQMSSVSVRKPNTVFHATTHCSFALRLPSAGRRDWPVIRSTARSQRTESSLLLVTNQGMILYSSFSKIFAYYEQFQSPGPRVDVTVP